jgi:hypothetical protein
MVEIILKQNVIVFAEGKLVLNCFFFILNPFFPTFPLCEYYEVFFSIFVVLVFISYAVTRLLEFNPAKPVVLVPLDRTSSLPVSLASKQFVSVFANTEGEHIILNKNHEH